MPRFDTEGPYAYWPLKEDTSKSAKTKNFNRKSRSSKACIYKYLKSLPEHEEVNNQTVDPLKQRLTSERLKRANQPDFDDGGMQASVPLYGQPGGQVTYSLNKKGRWNLVDRFRERMEDFTTTEDEENHVKVSTFEAEIRPDRSEVSVRAFHTTHNGHTVHRYPKQNKAFSTASGLATLEQSVPKKSRKKKVATFRRPNNFDDVTSREGPVEVVYELHMPSKSAALFQLAREKQRCNYVYGSSFDDAETADLKPKVRKFNVRAEALTSAEETRELVKLVSGQVADDDIIEEDVDSECAVEYIGSSGSDSYAIRDYMVDTAHIRSIAKAIKKLDRVERRCREKKKSPVCEQSESSDRCEHTSHQQLLLEPSFVRRHLLPSQEFRLGDESSITEQLEYTQDQAGPSSSKQATVTPIQSTIPNLFDMIPQQLQILAADLDSNHLKETYQDAYQEVACIPRRFLIDITAEVSKSLSSHLVSPDAQFLCIFEIAALPEMMKNSVGISTDYQNACACSFWVNGTFSPHVRTTFLKSINPCDVHSLNDLLQAAAKMIRSFPVRSFETVDFSQLPQPTTSFSAARTGVLVPVQGTLVAFSRQRALERALEVTHQLPKLQRQLSVVTKFMESNGASFCSGSEGGLFHRLCGVCCDEIVRGWCLASCQHWFCQDCWRQFLEDRTLLGVVPVTCPEYGCQSTVDYRVLTTVLPLPHCQRYAQLVQEQLIDTRSDQWCRCPNVLCQRLVHFETKSLPELVLTCECGIVWCRECGQKAHWPASCQQAKAYIEKLRLNGDDVAPSMQFHLDIRMVRVKACPHCKTLMEKRTGCNNMLCRCGQSFCWSCCKPWDSADHYKCRIAFGYEEITLVDVRPPLFKETERYRKCVAHLRATANRRLKSFANAAQQIEGTDPAACSDPKRRGHLLEFYKQAHNLIEYVYVWLCFAKTEQQATASITNLADRLHFLLLRIADNADNGAFEEVSASLPKIQGNISRLVNLMIAVKREEYKLANS